MGGAGVADGFGEGVGEGAGVTERDAGQQSRLLER